MDADNGWGAMGSRRISTWRGLARLIAIAGVCVASAGTFADDASARDRKRHAVNSARGHVPLKRVRVATRSPNALQPSNEVSNENSRTEAYRQSRSEILNTDIDRLERVGRHLIVGYQNFDEVRKLVERRAIAGIFITDHNVRNRSAGAVKADIELLQDMRARQGLPPLIVAADQEGGSVSRLSPPLKRQRSLGLALSGLTTDADRKAAVEAYAAAQARELLRIGVTLNFAPVVDLNLNPQNRSDGETRLRLRAISADPYMVAKVAGWYCDKIAEAGIMCTLKHFPGLGRVARDTHVTTGEIGVSEGLLELNDWVPFRRLMGRVHVATMLGHVRVGAIDKETPASYSKPVVTDLIRGQWDYDGLLITDDFSMGAITRTKDGAGRAAVRAIDAGVDLVLVSFLEKDFDPVISALLAAEADQSLGWDVRDASRRRVARIIKAATVPVDAK